MNNGLQSAHAKIRRAMEQRQSVEDLLAEYGGRKPYRIIDKGNGKVTVELTEPPPIEISVIAGEVIYQLRSALDHIFFALVQQSYPGHVPDAVRTTCQFPLYSKPPGDPDKNPVWSKYSSVHSRGLALVIFEQTAQPLSASHLPLLPIQR